MKWLATAAPAAGEEVHVDVVDDLPALRAAVHSEPVAALGEARRFAQRLRGEEAATQRLGVARLHRHDRRNVAPRDDQEVHRRLRIDVAERDDRVVLVFDIRDTLAGDDATEHTVRHGASSTPCYNTRLSSRDDSRRSARWERVRSESSRLDRRVL